jgi:hypothetical protein
VVKVAKANGQRPSLALALQKQAAENARWVRKKLLNK